MWLLHRSLGLLPAPVLSQQVRYKGRIRVSGKPRQPSWFRREMLAVSKPLWVAEHEDTEHYYLDCPQHARVEEKKVWQEDLNQLELLYSQEMMDYFRSHKMISFFHANPQSKPSYHKAWQDGMRIGAELKKYSLRVGKHGLRGTEWENCLHFFLSYPGESHLQPILFSQEVNAKQVMNFEKKVPEFFLLGAVVENRILSRAQIMELSSMPSIDTLRGELSSILQTPARKISHLLGANQQQLSVNLERLSYQILVNQPVKMPSDHQKKRAAKKKEAAKAKGGKKVEKTVEDSPPPVEVKLNGNASNGVKEVKEKSPSNGLTLTYEEELIQKLEEEARLAAEARACTGVLGIHPLSRDIKIDNFSVTFHGAELLQDTKLELSVGNRYGLLGPNGCGKSSLLAVLGNREVPVQNHIDIYYLAREMPASEKTAIQAVMEADEERIKLEKLAEELATQEDDESQDYLMQVYERLDDLGADTAEARASHLLSGLGFTSSMQVKKCKDFSGGWRMRVALARALFIRPHLLLLDEPTNHLDLEACVWLEEELKVYSSILVLISHSQDFLNGVCNNIMHMDKRKLKTYGGNYDTFIRTRLELLENQQKQYQWEQDQIAHMKNYIARFGHGSAKLARQAQSKEKTLAKMVAGGLTEKVVSDRQVTFCFYSCGDIPPPVIMVQNVSFRYSDTTPFIYKNLEFGMDLDTRIALVGPNGAGKSTLLKLIYGELIPSEGMVRRHNHLKLARYHQHLHELLEMELSPLDYMLKMFPKFKERDEMRKVIGRYGITGKAQTAPIKQLSDGQRCRVVFAWLSWQVPHMLLLDEPTNHLDMETIDALADAINGFEGGVVLVSHDFRLIDQVAKEIWICEKQTVTKWEGDILSYKDHLKGKVMKESNKDAKKKGLDKSARGAW